MKKYDYLIMVVLIPIPMLIYLFLSIDLHQEFFIGITIGIIWGVAYSYYFRFINQWNMGIHAILSPFGGVVLVSIFLSNYSGQVYFMSSIAVGLLILKKK